MRKAAKSSDKGREALRFDEGELWCTDEGDPPLNPAGWYFRARRSPDQPWIGPYPSRDEAEEAPCVGDPLRLAERRLKQWKAEQDAEPLLEPLVPMPEPEPEPVFVAEAPVLEPEPDAGPPAPASVGQLALDLGARPDDSQPNGRARRRAAKGAAPAPGSQADLPF